MTKQEFLEGVEFKVKPYDNNTFCLKGQDSSSFYILRNICDSQGKKILSNYEASVEKMGPNTFKAFNFVLGKRILVYLRFEDLIKVENEEI